MVIFHLRSIFTWFEVAFKLQINLGKSELVSVGEVPCLAELADIFECKAPTLPLKYLG